MKVFVWQQHSELCIECGSKVEAVIELGAEPFCDSLTTYVCLPCLKKAVELLEEAR